MKRDFDIQTHGARTDAAALNTDAIQKAIGACHQAGGGRVECPAGRFVTGTLTLKSNVELHLAAGCALVGSSSAADYQDFEAPGFRAENAPEGTTKSLIRAVGAENIAITGPGQIDGGGLAFYDTAKTNGRFFEKPPTPRPRMVMFHGCRNVRLEDAAFVDSPMWAFWLMKCRDVAIRGIRIRGDQRMINNDGIDIDSCRDVTVSDCEIKTSDDCIALRSISQVYETPAPCENITVTNCELDSWCNGIRVGCPSDDTIRDCTLKDLRITSAANGIQFGYPRKYLWPGARETARVHDISFTGVSIQCKASPIKIFVQDGIALRRLSDLAFSDLRIRSGKPCLVQGSPETIVGNVTFDGLRIETPGRDAVVSGHCKGLKLNKVELSSGVGDPPT